MIGRPILLYLDLAEELGTDLSDLTLRSVSLIDQIFWSNDLHPLRGEVDREHTLLLITDLHLKLADQPEDGHLHLLASDRRRMKRLAIERLANLLHLIDVALGRLL